MNMNDQLLKNRTLYHFYQLCQIPHGSHDEERLSTHLLHWAQELGLEAYQDESMNLIIKKPASPDRQSAAPVMLQAHLDITLNYRVLVGHYIYPQATGHEQADNPCK